MTAAVLALVAVAIGAVILAALVGRLWEDVHTCHLPDCAEWTPETGPSRLCPHHRYQALSAAERRWADHIADESRRTR